MHYREVHETETAYSGHSDNVDSLAYTSYFYINTESILYSGYPHQHVS